MRFIGIDLSWKMKPRPEEKRSAVACLGFDGNLERYEHCTTDKEIISLVDKLSTGGCVMGINAPLVVPPDTEGSRVCEGQLLDMKIKVLPTDPRSFDRWYGGCRGVVLLETLSDTDHGYQLTDRLPASTDKAVAETNPSASWMRLFGRAPKYKGIPMESKRQGLFKLKERLKSGLPEKYPALRLNKLDMGMNDLEELTALGLDIYGDALDAVMSAYTMLLWAREPKLCEVVGDVKRGFVVLPRTPPAR
jgi:predicted RNase H-like nuclease